MQLSFSATAINKVTLLRAPSAATFVLKGTLKAASSLQIACNKIQIHFSHSEYPDSENKGADRRFDLRTTSSLISSLRKSLSLDDLESLDKLKKTFSLLNFSLLEKVESAYLEALDSSTGYANKNLQEAKKYLILAKDELDQVHQLLLSLEKLRSVKSDKFIKLKSQDGIPISLYQEDLRRDHNIVLCSAERFGQYLKRNCPKTLVCSDFLHLANTPLCIPDFVDMISNRFASRELSSSDLEAVRTIFRFFNHEQRFQIGKYLCSLISPTYQAEAKVYLKKLERLSSKICKLTGTANFSAQLLELLSAHRFSMLGRSLQSMSATQLFSIQPNGAVVFQRIYDASNPKSSSIAAVTSLGILPLISGELKEEKWNLFQKNYKLKQINISAVPLNGGIVAHYQVGVDASGTMLPEAVICPLKSSIPPYLAMFIVEAVRPIKRASA